VVLTGYNTDIEHAGTVYHVQTEDKGRSNPFVESLVYASGEILYSRKTPYHDLVDQELDPQTIATMMDRQHRAIVEAIGAGRLKQLLEPDDEATDDDTTVVHPEPILAAVPGAEPSLDQVILDYLESQRERAHLILRAASDHDFAYGKLAKVSIVGTGMQNTPGFASRMFTALSQQNINIELISTSEIRITCIIDEARVRDAVRALHRAFEVDTAA